MNKQEFEKYIQSFCLKNNIDFKIFEGRFAYTVMNNSECAGFFESNAKIRPTLGIAKELPEQTFYEVLAHEFSHANQYLENSPFWINSRLTKEEVAKFSTPELNLTGFETGDLFSLWLDKKIELPQDVLLDMVKRTTEVEFDCERRTLELAKTLGLNINPKTYAQKANAYLITYFYALKNRRWTTSGHATYSKSEVYTALPKSIDPVFCQKLPQAIEELITLYCVKD